jgi:hypothetical protein
VGKKLNAAWHAKNRMPERPTREEQTRWHRAHARACGCRPIPPKLLAEVQKWKSR